MSWSEDTADTGNSQETPAEECMCELDENLKWLRRTDIFAGVPLERLRVYAMLCKRRKCRAGEFLFEQGQPDDKAYIIISGKAQVLRRYRDRTVIVQELEEGDFFGGLALLATIQRLFAVRAATDLELLYIDRETFRKIIRQFPELVEKILDVMIRRIVKMEEKILERYADEFMVH